MCGNSLERFHNYVNDQLRDGQNRLDMYAAERHAFADATAVVAFVVVVVALICLRVNCKCFLFWYIIFGDSFFPFLSHPPFLRTLNFA